MKSSWTTDGTVYYGKGNGFVMAAAVTPRTQPSTSSYTTSIYVDQPPNQLELAFIALCACSCCWPALVFAIVGIVYSIQVDNQWTNKDYTGAQRSSRAAKWWSTVAIVAGMVMFGIYIVLLVLSFVGASSSYT